MQGKKLYKFPTFYGYPVAAYMPVVGEKFGPWTVIEVGIGPFIGRTWGELSFPDGTVLEMSGVKYKVTGASMSPVAEE